MHSVVWNCITNCIEFFQKHNKNEAFLKLLLIAQVCFIYTITAFNATDVHFTGQSWSFHGHFTCPARPFDVFCDSETKAESTAASHVNESRTERVLRVIRHVRHGDFGATGEDVTCLFLPGGNFSVGCETVRRSDCGFT